MLSFCRMKLLLASVLTLQLSCLSQEPQPVAAPNYRIPLPEGVAAVRSADGLPKIDDVWESEFFRCLVTEDDVARTARLLELITTTPKEQLAAGSRAFQRMDAMGLSTLRLPERDLYWEHYGRIAREAAVKEAAALTVKDPARNPTLARKALEGWAMAAPEEAAKWFDERPDPVAADVMMLRPLVVGWASRDIKAATKYFLDHAKPGTREFQDGLLGLRDAVVVRGFIPGLTDWFNSLPDEEAEQSAKSAALAMVLQRVDGVGMEDAIRFLDGVTNRKLITDTVVSRFASQWAARGKSPEAMKWALSRPKDDKGNRAGVSVIAQIWAGKDPKAFSQWLLENRENENLDQILLGFVKHLSGRDITEARKWIKEIKSPTVRKEAEDAL